MLLRLIFIFSAMVISQSVHAQVTSVDYLLEYNEANCEYDFSIVTEGAAEASHHRFQGNGQISFLTKAGSGLTITERYAPTRISNPTIPNNWSINVIAESPTENPDFDYYAIGPALSPTCRYDTLNAVDTVKLFSITTTEAVFDADDLRLLDLDNDPTIINGGDYTHGFTIGGLTQLYDETLPTTYPTDIGAFTGSDTIFTGSTTTVDPVDAASWTSGDPAIAAVQPDGSILGIAIGTCTLEYTTVNGCTSSIELTVEEAPVVLNDRVGIGTTTPDYSAILDITSTDKGLLPPRMTDAQRQNIQQPAAGLIVYQTNTPAGLYLHTDTGWELLALASGTTGNRAATKEGCSSIEELYREVQTLKSEIKALKEAIRSNR